MSPQGALGCRDPAEILFTPKRWMLIAAWCSVALQLISIGITCACACFQLLDSAGCSHLHKLLDDLSKLNPIPRQRLRKVFNKLVRRLHTCPLLPLDSCHPCGGYKRPANRGQMLCPCFSNMSGGILPKSRSGRGGHRTSHRSCKSIPGPSLLSACTTRRRSNSYRSCSYKLESSALQEKARWCFVVATTSSWGVPRYAAGEARLSSLWWRTRQDHRSFRALRA